jgi:hypothetical protein
LFLGPLFLKKDVGRQVAISPLVLKAINEAGGFDTILTFWDSKLPIYEITHE